VPAVLYVVKLCAFLSTFSVVCEELTALHYVVSEMPQCLAGDYLYVLLNEMSAVDCVTAVVVNVVYIFFVHFESVDTHSVLHDDSSVLH